MLYDRYKAEMIAETLIPREKWHPYPTRREPEAWQSLPAELREGCLRAGDGAVEKEWPSLPATLYLEYARVGNRSRFQAPNGERRSMLRDLVVAECIEAKGRFLDQIVNGVWCLCEESSWSLPAHIGAQKAGVGLPDVTEPVVDLFSGETAALLAWTHYLLGESLDEVSPLVRPRIVKEVGERVLAPCLARDDWWWLGLLGARSVNNWNPWINSNWLTSALLLEENETQRRQAVLKSMRSLDVFINGYPSDGGCDEGPSYWGRAGASLLDCLELLYSATGGGIDAFGEPLVGEMGRFIYRAHIHKHWCINFADASAVMHPSATLVFRYGQRIGDETMMSFGAYLARLQDILHHGAGDSIGRALPGLFCTEELLGAAPAEPHLRDVWLPETQVMVARSQAGRPAGLLLAAKGGHNAESHNHNDVGQFMVYADGHPVLIDIGVEAYTRKTFSPQRYEIWTMQSQYHNLPTVNGVMQSPGREFAARDVTYGADDGGAWMALDIAGAYPPEAGLVSWRRRLTMERKGDIIVEDAWECAEAPRELFLTLMTPCKITVDLKGMITFSERELGQERISGRGHLRFDATRLNATVESITLEDGGLQRVWGDVLYRIRLHVKSPKAKDACAVRIGRNV